MSMTLYNIGKQLPCLFFFCFSERENMHRL